MRRGSLRLKQRVLRRIRMHAGRLRWVIKVSAPPGPQGDAWGDVAFADDLATALKRRGQTVRIDRLGENKPEDAPWDDVVLTLRGLSTPELCPNAINLLWVISHPELVENEEITAGWHRVYAGSVHWAGRKTEETGTEVVPLLQAVSKDRFGPVGPVSRHEVLFVGTTRRVKRPVVLDAVRTGAAVEIYGHGWQDYVSPSVIRGDHLPFGEVPAAYRGARRVLNDHWEDMRREGFISNRLFDAVASGARVVSDWVTGMDELFGPMVRSYESIDELVSLLEDDDLWPAQSERARHAYRVLEQHSFDARADVLVHDARSAQIPRSK